jgi:hypothetical protein
VDALLKSLKSKVFQLKNVTEKNAEWYMNQLALTSDVMLSQESIQSAINIANANAEKQNKCTKLISLIHYLFG